MVLLTPPVPIPPGLQAVPEREPSDPAEGPMSLPLAGSPGLAVVGALSEEGDPPDDEDVYAVELPGTSLPSTARLARPLARWRRMPARPRTGPWRSS